MEITRRQFGRLAVAGAALAAVTPATLLLTGCPSIDQGTIAALLAEIETAWSSLETSLGKALPANLQTLFAQAVAAVKGWVAGTPVQDVIQVLQDLSVAIGQFGAIPGLTSLEVVGIQIILGTVVNIIELIDPAAVPPITASAQVALRQRVSAANSTVVPPKHFRQGQIKAVELKKQFEVEWLAQTGKAAA